jgi:hypothetical protein
VLFQSLSRCVFTPVVWREGEQNEPSTPLTAATASEHVPMTGFSYIGWAGSAPADNDFVAPCRLHTTSRLRGDELESRGLFPIDVAEAAGAFVGAVEGGPEVGAGVAATEVASLSTVASAAHRIATRGPIPHQPSLRQSASVHHTHPQQVKPFS